MGGQVQSFLDLVELHAGDGSSGVLFAVSNILLQGQVSLVVSNGGGSGAHGLKESGGHRVAGNTHLQAFQVRNAVQRGVGGHVAGTVVDGGQAVNVAGFLQAFAQGLVNLAVGAVELHQVVGIIKHIPGVHNGHRLVLGCELSRSVHIQVQVAALDGGVHFRSRTKGAVGVNFNGNRAAAVLIDQLGEALSSNVDLVVSGLGVAKAQGNGLVAGCSGAFSGARSTRSSRRCCGAAAGGQHTGGHNGAQDFQCFFHGVCASLFLRFLFLFIWDFLSGKLSCGLHALKNARSVVSLSTSPLLDRNCEDSMDKTCHCYQIPLFYAPYHLLESRFLCTYWQTTQRNRSSVG